MSDLSEALRPIAPEFSVPRRRARGPVPRPPSARAARAIRTGARSPRPDRPLLPEAPAIFPWLARRFAEGEATVWIGPETVVSRLLEILYAGSAQAGGRISLIEGANRIHPYRVAETGRLVGTDPEGVLRRIRLARAFTAYQLVGLVDGWAREVRRHRPTLLVAHGLPNLFDNAEEVPPEERTALLTHVAGVLRTLSEASGLPMLLTLDGPPATFPGLSDHGPRLFDVVRCRPRTGSLALESYREVASLALVPRPSGQRGLEEFGGVAPEEVVLGWDAPPPRTGRPWRNG